MSFEFTVALVPNTTSFSRELQYLKAALLYSDKVRLISPVAYIFLQLTDENYSLNDASVLKHINSVMPFIKAVDANFYAEVTPVLNEMAPFFRYKDERRLSYANRLKIDRELAQLRAPLLEVSKKIFDTARTLIGSDECQELNTLIRKNKVIIEPFEWDFDDTDAGVYAYFRKLQKAVRSSYPLFDEDSNQLMRAAVNENIINLSEVERKRITHASLADNYIQRLPSFEEATADEILDIKKELAQSVVRFRSGMIAYTNEIQSLPWDRDFPAECALLYDQKIAPAVLEIEEATRANTFIKNVGRKFFTDDGAWKSTGGMVASIATAGVILM